MASKNDPLLNQSSSFGTTGGTTLAESSTTTTTTTTTATDILNTDEDSLSGTPLRADLTSGLDSDVSAGTVAGTGFSGNRDADTDTGLGYATTTVSETYAVPSAITVDTDTSGDNKLIAGAKDAAHSAKSAVASATENVKNQAGQIAEQAKSKVGELTSQATDKVKEQIGGQKAKAAEGLTTITEAIRQTASSLEEKGQAPIAGAVTGFAGQIENFAGYLQDKSVDELAEDVTAYAKQNPQVFIGGAFLLGIAIARFLKSSKRTNINGNNVGGGYYNTARVSPQSNSFDSTPVIPAYTGTTVVPDTVTTTTTTFNDAATTDYARDSATLGTGSTLTGTGTTGYSTSNASTAI